ncbi:hypothetical protein DCO48_11725 [Pseudomonas sp. SDI]|uniref:hypothetical protein n=1 Tax=Pseudomonas sp. SDI TaxID=2170734 RepID=UPI000DE6677C|nr:hypothetical protein [Pseudomonas sp. SDI]PWB33057.1 hypothetical protein DCO48_11725 [Pseudomonas sp. SDI]
MSIVSISRVSAEVPAQFNAPPHFHVVAISKFLIMLVFTMGLYAAYWYYRNWSLCRGAKGSKWVPLLLCFLGPFTLYPLLRRVSQRAAVTAPGFVVSPLRITLMYWLPTLLLLVLSVLSAIPASPVRWLVMSSSIAMWIAFAPLTCLTFVSMVCAQQAINIAEGDAAGRQNFRITWLNATWMAIGTLIIYAWSSLYAIAWMLAQRVQ